MILGYLALRRLMRINTSKKCPTTDKLLFIIISLLRARYPRIISHLTVRDTMDIMGVVDDSADMAVVTGADTAGRNSWECYCHITTTTTMDMGKNSLE